MSNSDKVIKYLLERNLGSLRRLFLGMDRMEIVKTLQDLQTKINRLPYYAGSFFPADREWSLREAIAYISTPGFSEHFIRIFKTRV